MRTLRSTIPHRKLLSKYALCASCEPNIYIYTRYGQAATVAEVALLVVLGFKIQVYKFPYPVLAEGSSYCGLQALLKKSNHPRITIYAAVHLVYLVSHHRPETAMAFTPGTIFRITIRTPRYYTEHPDDNASQPVSPAEIYVDASKTYIVRAMYQNEEFTAVKFRVKGRWLWTNVEKRQDSNTWTWAVPIGNQRQRSRSTRRDHGDTGTPSDRPTTLQVQTPSDSAPCSHN